MFFILIFFSLSLCTLSQTQHKSKISHTQPLSSSSSYRLLRWATDPTQTQNHPHPAASHRLLRGSTDLTQTQNHPHLATINDQIEQNHPASYRLLDAKLEARPWILNADWALGYPHLADRESQRGSKQNKITHTQPRITPVRSILRHCLCPINTSSPTSAFPTHLSPKLADRTQSVARNISVELSSSSSSKPEILKKKEKLIGFAELRWEKERAVMKWERESWDESET